MMKNETQLNRYKKLLKFIDEKFKEDINIPEIEEACNYSYRNINRIFVALNHETIGKYIKRMRLERAGQYLKYSDTSISDIAYDLGFSDIASFSKAFKNKFHCSPSAFRESHQLQQEIIRKAIFPENEIETRLNFEVEELPEFQILGLEYHGAYEDISAINQTWKQFIEYVSVKNLITEKSIFMAEILDDEEITEDVFCRYNVAMIVEKPLKFTPEALFKIKTIPSRKYAKFIHKGSHESSLDTYQMIYSHWMTEVKQEMADAPVLEFFLNDEEDTPPEELLTEIYIPIE